MTTKSAASAASSEADANPQDEDEYSQAEQRRLQDVAKKLRLQVKGFPADKTDGENNDED